MLTSSTNPKKTGMDNGAENSKVSATAIKCEHGFSHGGKTFSIYITERTSAREGNASMSDVVALRKQSDQFVSPYFFVRSVNDPTQRRHFKASKKMLGPPVLWKE